ncbi:MAG: hypothetical protein R3195_12215 [Gemmatimonadota bacterium]|nr:hypothetical protein [Gemmatimonadota bacterium]
MNDPVDCLDADDALSLTQVLGSDPAGRLVHVAACGECRGRLDEIARVREAVVARAPRAGFTDEVMAVLPATRRRGAGAWVFGAVNALITFGLVLVGLLTLGAVEWARVAFGLAGLAAVAAAVWSLLAGDQPAERTHSAAAARSGAS